MKLTLRERFELWYNGVTKHGDGYLMKCHIHGVVESNIVVGYGDTVVCPTCLEEDAKFAKEYMKKQMESNA